METKTATPLIGGAPWLIGVKKAAELMSVSYRQMYAIANIEGFPSLRIGSRIMIDPLKLRNWIDDNMGGGVNIE